MPKHVALPDGGVIEFPDGMSDAEIGAAIESVSAGPLAPASGPTREKPPTPAQPLLSFVEKGGKAVNPLAWATEAPGIIRGLQNISKTRWEEAKKLADNGEPGKAFLSALSAGFPGVELSADIVANLGAQHWDQLTKSWAAVKAGHGGAAYGHWLGAVVPMIGPFIANEAEKYAAGDPEAGGAGGLSGTIIGTGIGLGLGAFGPQSFKTRGLVKPTTNPVLKSATAFGERRGVPMDLPTRSGSDFLRGTKNMARRSLFGRTAEADVNLQKEALQRVGTELALETRLGQELTAAGRQNMVPLSDIVLEPSALRKIEELRPGLINETQTSGFAGTRLEPVAGRPLSEVGQTVAAGTATPGPNGPIVTATPQTPFSSGGNVQSSLLASEKKLGQEAGAGYKRAEAIQADPVARVTVEKTPQEIEAALAARRNRMQQTLGGDLPTPDELRELQHIRDRLETGQGERGGLVRSTDAAGEVTDTYQRGRANDSIYHDILDAAPGTSDLTAKHMQDAITKAIETGEFSYAAQGALQVARKRIAAGQGNTASRAAMGLEPEVLPGVAKTYDVQMPVDIGSFRRQGAPLLARLESQLSFARQPVKDAYAALKQLMDGPEQVPLSQVESALGALKRMERGGQEVRAPGTRTANQGIAAREITLLEDSLQGALNRARSSTDLETYAQRDLFEQAVTELMEARKKTAEQYQVKDVRKAVGIKSSGEQVFQTLTQSGDFGADLLRRVQQRSPESVATVARAMTDQLIEISQTQGFEAAQRAWNKLGTRTRGMLYTPEHAQDLQRFFRVGGGRELVESVMTVAENKGLQAAQQKWKSIDPEIRASLLTQGHAKKLTQYFGAGAGRELVDSLMQTAKDKGYDAANRAWKNVDAKTRAEFFSPAHAEQLTKYFKGGRGRELVDRLVAIAQDKGYKSANTAWKNVDARTRAELFSSQHAQNLTDYFNLAEHMMGDPNPSGSAYGIGQGAQLAGIAWKPQQALPFAIGLGALSKLLHSDAGARVLMLGMRGPLRSTVAASQWAKQAGRLIEESDDEEKRLLADSK